jgi:hypothetical protein
MSAGCIGHGSSSFGPCPNNCDGKSLSASWQGTAGSLPSLCSIITNIWDWVNSKTTDFADAALYPWGTSTAYTFTNYTDTGPSGSPVVTGPPWSGTVIGSYLSAAYDSNSLFLGLSVGLGAYLSTRSSMDILSNTIGTYTAGESADFCVMSPTFEEYSCLTQNLYVFFIGLPQLSECHNYITTGGFVTQSIMESSPTFPTSTPGDPCYACMYDPFTIDCVSPEPSTGVGPCQCYPNDAFCGYYPDQGGAGVCPDLVDCYDDPP